MKRSISASFAMQWLDCQMSQLVREILCIILST
jgi:hypothetical protein